MIIIVPCCCSLIQHNFLIYSTLEIFCLLFTRKMFFVGKWLSSNFSSPLHFCLIQKFAAVVSFLSFFPILRMFFLQSIELCPDAHFEWPHCECWPDIYSKISFHKKLNWTVYCAFGVMKWFDALERYLEFDHHGYSW